MQQNNIQSSEIAVINKWSKANIYIGIRCSRQTQSWLWPIQRLQNEFLVPTEVYRAVGQHISVSNMIGLQRVRGLWGKTLTIKKIVNYYFHLLWCSETNQSTFTQEIPGMHSKKKLIQQRCMWKISADDGQIIKALEDHNCDILKFFRERLRIDNYLTNCQTGDLLIKKMYM